MNLLEVHEQMRECTACALSKERTQVVCGSGSSNADIMFIGEAPGANEDKQGLPFVGAAGKLLTQLLESVGIERKDVFICNTVACRPPNNRDPYPSEIHACSFWLDTQISIIQPRIIVCIGRYAMAKWFPGKMISKVHGTYRKAANGCIYFAMYHPAAALHNGNNRKYVEADIQALAALYISLGTVIEKPVPVMQPVQGVLL